MKRDIEKLFLVLSSWFIGMLGVGIDVLYNQLGIETFYRPTYFGFFAFIFFGFSIYFLLDYVGLINRDKEKMKALLK